MTKENKELLFRDLSMRLPYGARSCDPSTLVAYDFKLTTTTMYLLVTSNADHKPLLFPLSYLTKEITVNGETFVPLMRLFELAFGMNYHNQADKFDFRVLEGENAYGAFELNKETVLVFRDGNFTTHKDFDGVGSLVVRNQFKMYQWLIEHHFNVNNLPEELWIDVTTLDVNPYSKGDNNE